MPATMSARLVADALPKAVWRRCTPPRDVTHFHPGSQYSREQLQRTLAAVGILCGTGCAGTVCGNASLSTVTKERAAWKHVATTDAARADVLSVLERLYNSIRR
jgi:transposase InsO family protein